MPIKFEDAQCAKIIVRVGIPAVTGAATQLAFILEQSTERLVGQLQKAPFPDRAQVRQKVNHLKKPLRDFLSYYGMEIDLSTGRVRRNNASKWAQVLEQFAAHPYHDRPRDLEKKMVRVARRAHKLYNEVVDFEDYLNLEAGIPGRESLNSRKAATRLFIQELICASADLFIQPLTVINDRDLNGQDVHGPAITYLKGCLDLLRQRLNDAGFQHIADDHPLKISVNTLSRWFYEKSKNQ